MRYIECKECDMIVLPAWSVDGVLIKDNMITDEQRERAIPFRISHVSFENKNCPRCNIDLINKIPFCLITEDAGWYRCPECSFSVEKTGFRHRTEWTKEDLKDGDIYITQTLNCVKFPVSDRIRDLK